MPFQVLSDIRGIKKEPVFQTGSRWSGRRGSNSRPIAWKAIALSTELLPHFCCGRRWIRTTEGINQQIYSLPHLATLVFAQALQNCAAKVDKIILSCKRNRAFLLRLLLLLYLYCRGIHLHGRVRLARSLRSARRISRGCRSQR